MHAKPFFDRSNIQIYRLQYLAGYPKFHINQKVPWENSYCELTIIDSQKRLRSELKDGHTQFL